MLSVAVAPLQSSRRGDTWFGLGGTVTKPTSEHGHWARIGSPALAPRPTQRANYDAAQLQLTFFRAAIQPVVHPFVQTAMLASRLNTISWKGLQLGSQL